MILRISLCLYLTFATNILCQRNEDFLPKNVKPLRYTLTFEILNNTHFRGNAFIVIQALEHTNNVTFHAKDLYIDRDSVKVVDGNDELIENLYSTINEEKDFYTIHLGKVLNESESYNVKFDNFFGTITKDKCGIFKAEYQNPDNTTSYLVATEFSPKHARTAFPCFDETAAKAVFVINLIRSSEKSSASNMPLLETIDIGNNRYQDVYQATPLISTYLVAFVISDFEYTNNSGIVRILAPKHYLGDGSLDYLLKESPKIIEALEMYTEIKYPLPKLDLVTLPKKYFVDGAMENWGLVTYSDTYLNCPNTSSAEKIQVCFTYSSHEFAHQWFGNLATPKAWNYIWLSEGFGCYFQYHIGDKIKPNWRLKEQFVIEITHTCMKNDFNDEPINFIFSKTNDFPSPQIYYQKAASVIRMTSHILTENVFQTALQIYLKKNKYKATEPINLYNAYQHALEMANKTNLLGNLTIHEILESWTKNLGLPIVTAIRNYETEEITFSQKSCIDYDDNSNTFWHIPISYVFSANETCDFENTTADFWLSYANATVHLDGAEGWFLVNKQAAGYYQVNYDEINWKRLTTFLLSEDFTVIPPINRAQLINDAFYFVSQEALNPDILLNLTMYLTHETDYIPILCFMKNVVDISAHLKKIEDKEIFKIYIDTLLTASYLKLGIYSKDTDTHIDRLHRKQILIVCAINVSCQEFVLRELRTWISTGVSPFGKTLSPSVLCGAIQLATSDEWIFILEQYFSCTKKSLKKAYIRALACTKDEKIIERFLDEIFNVNNTMTQDDRTESFNKIGSETSVGKNALVKYLLNLEDNPKYADAFGVDADLYLEMPLDELDKYVPIIKRRIQSIHIAFLLGDDTDTDIAEGFVTWASKYLLSNKL